jgi:hypothetical protein
MVLSVDVKLDLKDGLEYATGMELHDSHGSEVWPSGSNGYGCGRGCGGGEAVHMFFALPL